jgi:hypothetical protein
MRVSVREFNGVVFDKTGGGKEYKICEWELDDGTFEYGLDCPLHSLTKQSGSWPKCYSERQDELVCPDCGHKYFVSESKAFFAC